MRQLALAVVMALPFTAVAEEAPSPLQKQLMGHWVADRDSHLHTYFSRRGRIFENSHPDNDASLAMMDYNVWDEWPESRTIVVVLDDGTHGLVTHVITFSEDGKFATVREKSAGNWTKAYKIRRMDDKTHPVTLPIKLKLIDTEHGLGAP